MVGASKGDTHVDFELLIETVVHDKGVSQANAMRLHRMPGDVGVVAHIGVVEVGDLGLVGRCEAVAVHVIERRE